MKLKQTTLQAGYLELRDKIETAWADRDLPLSVLQFYLLVDLLATRDLETYLIRYGLQSVDMNLAAEGKRDYQDLGELNSFEREAICHLNAEVNRRTATSF